MNQVESRLLNPCANPKLTLCDKLTLDRLLSILQPETSDLTFTNLYMWQNSYGLKPIFLPELDYWVLLAQPPAKWSPFFLPPVGDWTATEKLKGVLEAMDRLARNGGFKLWLRRIPKPLAESLQRIDPAIQFQEDRRTFDYIYETADLIKLEGRKYHSKRNHLNQFQRKYLWEYQRITPAILEECLAIDQEWFSIKDVFDRESTDEEMAMAIVMKDFGALGVTGGVIRVNGKIEAIAVGERLTADMGVIHIEKANTEFDGIYAAINQQFAADFGLGFQYINREEDMGLDGLRQAKNSYHPVRMIEKFNGERKN